MRLDVQAETWPLASAFTISRGSRTETEVVVATLTDGAWIGRGECMPNPRFGESQAAVVAVLDSRLATTGYGARLRASLPPLWWTTDLPTVVAALGRLDAALSELDPHLSGDSP